MTLHAHTPVEAAGKVLLDADAIARTLSRIAHEIIEANPDLTRVALVGIQTRGVPLAHRLRRLIEERAGAAPDLGAVDITFYRDDVQVRSGAAPRHSQPVVRSTALDFPLEGKTVVLVDDVLYTGRTIRAAIEALFDQPCKPLGERHAACLDADEGDVAEVGIRLDDLVRDARERPRERVTVEEVLPGRLPRAALDRGAHSAAGVDGTGACVVIRLLSGLAGPG